MSNTERENIVITIPAGYKIKLKSWLTGKERQSLNTILLSESSVKDKEEFNVNISNKVLINYQNESIIQYVLEIRDSENKIITANSLDFILDLKEDNYIFLIKEINTSKIKEEEVLKD